MKTPCPSMAHLTAYVLGELSQEHRAAIRAHIETCGACRAEAAAQAAAHDALIPALLADAHAPYALTPERLAAVLATPPAKPVLRRVRIPWRILGGVAAAVLVLMMVSAVLFPATSGSVKTAMAARAGYFAVSLPENSERMDDVFSVGGGARDLSSSQPESDFYFSSDAKPAEDMRARGSLSGRLGNETVSTPLAEAPPVTLPPPSLSPSPVSGSSVAGGAVGNRGYAGQTEIDEGKSVSEMAGSELAKNRTAEAGDMIYRITPGSDLGGAYDGESQAERMDTLPEGRLAAERGMVPATPASRLPARPENAPAAAGEALASREGGRDGRLGAEEPSGGVEYVPLRITLPKSQFTGTPKEIRNAQNLETSEDTTWRARRMVQADVSAPVVVDAPHAPGMVPPQGAAVQRPLAAGKPLSKKDASDKKQEVAGLGVIEESLAPMDMPVSGTVILGALRHGLAPAKESGTYDMDMDAFAEVADEAIIQRDASPREAEAERRSGALSQYDGQTDVSGKREGAEKAGAKRKSSEIVPQVNPFVVTTVQPLSTFAIGTDTASYTLTRQSLGNGMLPDPAVVRVEEFVNAFDYKDSAPERTTFRIIAEGAPSPFGRPTQLVRLAIKGKRLGREEQRPANLVFLVDASGSMAQPDRMGAVRLALDQLLQGLRAEDQLQIVTFNETARLVQPQVSASKRQEIMTTFNRIQTTGPTSLEGGMSMAYQQAVATFQPGAENRVILITDGVANLGSGEASDILATIDGCRRQGIRLSVFGVGRGTYNDTLLQQLANKGDGTYRFLDSPEAIADAFVNDLSATLYTIASDAKVQVEWFPRAVVEYRQLGYEVRALTAEQFRDDTVVAGQIGSGQAASALYELHLADTRAMPPDAALGIVRIRFRPSEGGAVEEISRPILRSDLAESFGKARPEFQLAAAAAGFAEHLRRSPYAPTQGYRDLATLIRPAAQQLYLDTRFDELVRLIGAAAAITQ